MGYIFTEDELAQIGARLKRAQLALQLSDEEMAEILGVGTDHYKYRIIKGQTLLQAERWIILINELGISIDYLLTGNDSKGIFVNEIDNEAAKATLKEQLILLNERIGATIESL